MSMAKRFGSFVLLLVYGLIPLATSSPLKLSTRNFNYANVTEHCDDLWSFTGNDEAPMAVTNVTLYPANATDGTPAFCHVDGQVATYNGVSIRLPASGAIWAGFSSCRGVVVLVGISMWILIGMSRWYVTLRNPTCGCGFLTCECIVGLILEAGVGVETFCKEGILRVPLTWA
jgi:hypothetical protein